MLRALAGCAAAAASPRSVAPISSARAALTIRSWNTYSLPLKTSKCLNFHYRVELPFIGGLSPLWSRRCHILIEECRRPNRLWRLAPLYSMEAPLTDTASAGFRLEIRDRVAFLTLCHGPVNVLRTTMLNAMAHEIERLRSGSLTALVVRAEGRLFSAGMDVAEHYPDHADAMLEAAHRFLAALWNVDLPVVAAVQGNALGGGFELLLACDAVLAVESVALGFPEVRVGAFPPFAASFLPRVLPWQTAFDLVARGRLISAAEAFRLGLVTQVVGPDGLDAALDAWLADLGSLSAPVVRQARRALKISLGEKILIDLSIAERQYKHELLALDDAVEGLRAFQEKRPPDWKNC
ncbi:MAG: enoyl-CoA hydratase/isomerase family protein [Armatimonadetes bacterium]|nr:enoyl-CoA hydratase/isomerase family protein [Armatimonadota bacterium]